MEDQQKSSNGMVWGVVGAVVLVAAVYGFYSYSGKGKDSVNQVVNNQVVNNTVTGTTVTTPTPTATPTAVVKLNMFKDGTYSSNGKYNSPAGPEEIGVTVSVKGDVITDATVKVLATNPASKNWQTKVSEGIKSVVVGKKLTDVVLDKVSGSSLTPKGWNDAVAKIQKQATI